MENEKKNIIEKISKLYHRFGIKSITMDDIAKELYISKKTLYKYFNDKAEIVEKVVDCIIADVNNYLVNIEIKKLNAIEELLWINNQIVKSISNFNPTMNYDLKKYYPHLYQKLNDVKRNSLYNYIVQNIEKGKKEGLYRKNLNNEIIAKLYVFRVEQMFESDSFSSEELNNPDFFNEIFIYHLRGIANDEGIKYLNNKLNE